MPAVYLLLVLGGLLLYLAFLAIALPIGAAVGLAACFLGMPVAYFTGLARVLVRRDPAWLSRAGPARWPKAPPGGDPAIPQYFYGPALADADHAVRAAYRDCRGVWVYCGRVVAAAVTGDAALLTAPFGIGGAIGLGIGVVFGAAAAACGSGSRRGVEPRVLPGRGPIPGSGRSLAFPLAQTTRSRQHPHRIQVIGVAPR